MVARPYPGPGAEVPVSVGGGQEPVWARSGREIFYRRGGKLQVAPVDEAGGSLRIGSSTELFDDPYTRDRGGAQGGMANYDVAPDGQHFVMVEEQQQGDDRGVRLQV